MADPNEKEFETLDELFRTAFNGLPATPAASGWDRPSERVWQHVQREIKPPKTGWSAQKLGLISAFGVSVAVGLYLLFARPDQPAPSPTSPAAPSMEQPVSTPQEATPQKTVEEISAEVTPAPTPETPAVRTRPQAPRSEPAAATTPANSTEKQRPADQSATAPAVPRERPNSGSVPLPGSRRVSPNTTEKLWRTPLELLPLRTRPSVPASPEHLRVAPEGKN
jgi:hypothetical protein